MSPTKLLAIALGTIGNGVIAGYLMAHVAPTLGVGVLLVLNGANAWALVFSDR